MRLRVKYNNGTPAFDEHTKVSTTSNALVNPVVLFRLKESEVSLLNESSEARNRKRQEAIAQFMTCLERTLRDLRTMHDIPIQDLSLNIENLALFEKKGDEISVKPTAHFDKYNLVVYSFGSDIFTEKLLFTCNGKRYEASSRYAKNKNTMSEYHGHLLNDALLTMSSKNKRQFLSILSLISNFPGYKAVVETEDNVKKIKYSYKGAELENIDDIPEDDVFLTFKFMEVFLARGSHSGVFFLDIGKLSNNVLKNLIAFISLNYINSSLIFLYSTNPEINYEEQLNGIKHETFYLPNHLLNERKVKSMEKINKKVI